jgi:hypothetical protein
MLFHLETGTCESGVDDIDVADMAYDFRYSLKYTTKHDDDYEFKCPTCDKRFDYMSSLFKHAEGDFCDEDPTSGPLPEFLRYIERRV